MRTFQTFFAALFVLSVMLLPVPASSAAVKPTIRVDIGRALNEALQAVQAKDFVLARDKAQLADMARDKTPFEEYVVAKYLSTIALMQPMPDYAAAQAAYDRIIASGGVPDADRASVEELARKLQR